MKRSEKKRRLVSASLPGEEALPAFLTGPNAYIGGRATVVPKRTASSGSVVPVRLEEVLKGLPQAVCQLWRAEGFETILDLAGGYTSAVELAEQLTLGGVPSRDHAEAVAAWEMVCCPGALGLAQLCPESPSSRPREGMSSSDSSKKVPSALRCSQARVRQVLLDGSRASTGSRWRHGAASAKSCNRVAVTQEIAAERPPVQHTTGLSQRTIDDILEVYIRVGYAGSRWIPDAVTDKETVRQLIAQLLRGADEARVRTAIRTLGRLDEWLAKRDVEPIARQRYGLLDGTLAKFLLEICKGGPTAARGVWHHLDWWHTKLGLPLPTRGPFLDGFSKLPPGHFARQAPVLQIEAFFKILEVLDTAPGVVANFCRLVLLLTVGCIRWRHQKRSTFRGADTRFFSMWCSLGKSREGGARRPFPWKVPRFLASKKDVLGPLVPFFQELYEVNPEAQFVVPDIELPRVGGGPGMLCEGAHWLPERPMPERKFLELMRGVLLQAGVPLQEASEASYNTLRRFLPSVAEVLGFDDPELQSLSNWAEIPKGKEASGRKAVAATHRIYAGDKWTTAGYNRQRVVVALSSARKALAAASADGSVASLDWSNLRAFIPDAVSVADCAASKDWELTGQEILRAVDQPEEAQAQQAEEAELAAASDSESSASSASETESVDSAHEEEVDLFAQPEEWPPAFATKERGKVHFQRHLAEGRAQPFCRERAFKNYVPIDHEEVRSRMAETGLCSPCWAKLPSGLRSVLTLGIDDKSAWVGQGTACPSLSFARAARPAVRLLALLLVCRR